MSARSGRLAGLVLLALASPLAAGTVDAAAPGKVKVGVDQEQNVSFSVNGRMVDVSLRPSGDQPNALAEKLSGESIVVACKGTSPKRGRVLIGDLETSWPTGATLLRGKLSRDVSDGLQWCVLEQPDGSDIAVTRKLRTPKPAS
jgi:hypothetical protein